MMMTHQTFRSICEQRKIPIISPNTELFLTQLLQRHKPQTCLEIGGAVAYSTIHIAHTISQRNGQIYSFERAYPAYIEGLTHTHKAQITNCTSYPFNFLQTDIEKLLGRWRKIDFVFIDAQKSQYGDYMMKIRNLLHTSTTIIIDDVIKYHHKMKWLYEFLQGNQINYETNALDTDDGVILIYK